MPVDTSVKTVATLEDLPGLVGVPLGPSSWRTVTQEEVQQFADLTGDHNPIHTDAEAGAASPFGTTIVHGYFTLALVVPLMAEIFEMSGVSTGINYGLDKLRFPAPVPVGARIRVGSVITAVDEVAGGRQIHVTSTFEIEGQAKPAAVAEMLLRFYA
jgi:acyl dehydratase